MVQGTDESVHLQRRDKQWVVQNRLNHPADIKKLSGLVSKLMEAKIGRVFESNEGSLKRLGLMAPTEKEVSNQEKGIRVIFKDEKEKDLANILLGKPREGGDPRGSSEGHYLRLEGDSRIYLVDRDFSSLEASAPHWLETELLNVPASDIQGILCQSTDQEELRYAFERPAEGNDFEAVQFPAGKQVDESALSQLSGTLSSLHMEDVADPSVVSESSLQMSHLIEFRLFNGLLYRLWPSETCSDGDSCYLKIEVAYQKPTALSEKEDDQPGESKKQEELQPDLSRQALELNEKFDSWIYIIPNWKKDAFITDVSKLVEEAEE